MVSSSQLHKVINSYMRLQDQKHREMILRFFMQKGSSIHHSNTELQKFLQHNFKKSHSWFILYEYILFLIYQWIIDRYSRLAPSLFVGLFGLFVNLFGFPQQHHFANYQYFQFSYHLFQYLQSFILHTHGEHKTGRAVVHQVLYTDSESGQQRMICRKNKFLNQQIEDIWLLYYTSLWFPLRVAV